MAEQKQEQTAPPAGSAWSLRIGRVAGIPIYLHFTFLILIVWIAFGTHGGTVLQSVGFVLALFTCVVLHELGHSIVAIKYGIPVADITLYPIGGVSRIEKRPTAKQEFWISIAGPVVNVFICVGIATFLVTQGVSPTHLPTHGWRYFVLLLGEANMMLVVFNLIPAFPMDGGRILRAVLAMTMPPAQATRVASSIGQVLAMAIGLYGLFIGQPLYVFVAFFVYIGAGQEAFAYRQAVVLEGVPVCDAMITDVRSLSVGNTLKEAADILLNTSQHDFPVLHGETVQGILTRDGLLRALSDIGPTGYVAGAMNREFARVAPDDQLTDVLPRLQAQSGPLLVLDAGDDKLLGMVTRDNVSEYFAVRQIVNRKNKDVNARGGML